MFSSWTINQSMLDNWLGNKKHYLDYLILMLWGEPDIVQKEDISRLTKYLNKTTFYVCELL